MPGTRSSSRIAAQSSSPSTAQGKSSPPKESTGTKRKQGSNASPSAKQDKTAIKKKQRTIEQTIGSDETITAGEHENDIKDQPSQASLDKGEASAKARDSPNPDISKVPEPKDVEMNDSEKRDEADGDNPKADHTSHENDSRQEKSKVATNGAVEPDAREEETPSSILEKGIIYFFFRGRVGIDQPSSVKDIARSFMVLRPLPHGAKLGEGPIGDAGNCRLLALPKKVLPLSGRDKFLVFVEKAQLTFKDLKETFLPGSDYETKTAGTRHTPAATPVGEGIYAITTTGRESHLAYLLTIPTELSEVQQDVGIRKKGSFITSTRNPKYPAPPSASLPNGPDYPKEIIDEFRSLRWTPLQPKHLDHANAQFLLIGEEEGAVAKATQPQPQDEKESKEKPLEELEKLEGEDEIRVKHLKGDDAVFADLQVSSEEYPKLQTTWW